MKKKINTYILSELLGSKTETVLSNDADLLSNGLIDSIGVMQLIKYVEDQFEIRVPPEDMVIENFRTINTIEDYIKRRLEQ